MPIIPNEKIDARVYNWREKKGLSFREISRVERISLGGAYKRYVRHLDRLAIKKGRSRKVENSI